jgi:pyruvate dehydrogenase E2 component (dihydrolipoamide acetyltransferase)
MIRNANQKSLLELPAMVNELVNKTRKGDLSIEEVTGGTFTITNLGMFEVEAFTPIINPGQMAILGIGKISTKPIVTEDKIEIRPITTLSLTFDHRVLDGSTAAQFLQKIKQIIENADKLL